MDRSRSREARASGSLGAIAILARRVIFTNAMSAGASLAKRTHSRAPSAGSVPARAILSNEAHRDWSVTRVIESIRSSMR